jgi:hypothetical protein
MNSFLPFDWVQCSWLGTERVVTVAFMASPSLSCLGAGTAGFLVWFAVSRGEWRGKYRRRLDAEAL